MINIKSDTDTHELDIEICGYEPELIMEFGNIIRAVCQNFITKMVNKEDRKSFASELALLYVKEIKCAYEKAIE